MLLRNVKARRVLAANQVRTAMAAEHRREVQHLIRSIYGHALPSWAEMARELTRQGVPTPRGLGAWQAVQVQRALYDAPPTYRILVGNCLDLLRTLGTESVQCVLTSPPYFGLRDYGHPGQIGQELTHLDYVAKIVKAMGEVRRVLKPDGVIFLNMGDSYVANASTSLIPRAQQGNGTGRFRIPSDAQLTARRMAPNRATPLLRAGLKMKSLMGIPWRTAIALQDDDWIVRNDIIWHKPHGMPERVRDRFSRSHEDIFLLAKSRHYSCDPAVDGPRNVKTVWTFAPSRYPGAHFATMPLPLAERCILAGSRPSDVVLDLFGGVGTSAVAALRNGRLSITVELNPTYARMAEERLAAEVERLRLG